MGGFTPYFCKHPFWQNKIQGTERSFFGTQHLWNASKPWTVLMASSEERRAGRHHRWRAYLPGKLSVGMSVGAPD